MVKLAAIFSALLATVVSAAVVAPKPVARELVPATSNTTEVEQRDVYGSGEDLSELFYISRLHTHPLLSQELTLRSAC